MIEINLLPGSGKKKATRRQAVDFGAAMAGVSGRMRDKFAIGATVAVLVAAGAFAFLYLGQQKRETELTARKDAALADSTRYANFLKDRYRAESTRDSLLRQVNLIVSLDEDRYVWPHVLDEISRALPQYTWLTTLGYAGAAQGSNNVVVAPKNAQDTSAAAKKRNAPPKRMDTAIPKDVISIRLQGRTVDIQAVTRFMRDLEASPYFSGVLLDKSEPVTDNGKEVAQFQLTFGFSRPDTLLLRRAPLSISVR
jgi:Tfp pilus assembly protein PilN